MLERSSFAAVVVSCIVQKCPIKIKSFGRIFVGDTGAQPWDVLDRTCICTGLVSQVDHKPPPSSRNRRRLGL